MPESLPAAAVVADVLARQHLVDGARATAVVATAADLVGLHATGAMNPYLQLFERLEHFARDDLDEQLYDRRTLAEIRCMRGTLFVLPLDLVPIAWGATNRTVLRLSTAYLESRGVSPAAYAQWTQRILDALAGGAASTADLRRILAAPTDLDLSAVVNQLCDEGLVVRDRPVSGWRDARHTYRRFADALPGVSLDVDEDVATAALVQRYVTAYGPVTLDDISWWTGLGVRRCGAAVDALGDHLVTTRVQGWDGAHVADLPTVERIAAQTGAPAAQVAVLSYLDPLMMGYRDRARLLDAAHHDLVYDRGGNATNVILLGGMVTGVWDIDPVSDQALCYRLAAWTPRTSTQVHRRLQRLASFVLGAPAGLREVPTMTPLPARRAGWFMKPLRS